MRTDQVRPEQPAVNMLPDVDSLFSRMIELTQLLRATPTDTFLMRMLLETSLDPGENNIFTVGTGIIAAADTLDSLKLAIGTQGAARNADHCALVLKAWLQGYHVPFDRRIFGRVLYRRHLLEKRSSDTLYQLYRVPVTSIVLD